MPDMPQSAVRAQDLAGAAQLRVEARLKDLDAACLVGDQKEIERARQDAVNAQEALLDRKIASWEEVRKAVYGRR